MSAAVSSKGVIRGWHVLAALVGFFLTVTAVDLILVTKAVSTFSGDTADAYRKGLAYNHTLEEEAIQDRLGWHESRSFEQRTGRLSITVTDENKTPVDGLRLQADIGRAATDIFDRSIMLEPAGSGTYGADIAGLAEGAWTLSVKASEDGKIVYRSRARIWKQP